jgi:ADP-ribose pyrophosphatase YjhB (NUDIX family)
MPNNQNETFYKGALPMLVAVDCVIWGFDRQVLKLLLFKRKVAPFKNAWSVIGSFVQAGEGVNEAAGRVLKETAGLQNIFMEPLGCYGAVDRDPGARVVSQAFFALIRLGEEEVQIVETHHAHWFDLTNVPDLILDHGQMVTDALGKLQRKARFGPIGFELLQEKFTLPQLQNLYEAIYQRAFDRRNFRKKILSMNILEKLDEKDKSSRKGAFLYRFDQHRYHEMVQRGFDFVL